MFNVDKMLILFQRWSFKDRWWKFNINALSHNSLWHLYLIYQSRCFPLPHDLSIGILSITGIFKGVWMFLAWVESVAGYLGLALVFGRWVIVPWGLGTFLIFPNFLGFLVLSRSAAREAIPLYTIYHIPRIYHFYK